VQVAFQVMQLIVKVVDGGDREGRQAQRNATIKLLRDIG
jgi:hypothetical protein